MTQLIPFQILLTKSIPHQAEKKNSAPTWLKKSTLLPLLLMGALGYDIGIILTSTAFLERD
jgi:hypothetical protein